MVLTAGLLFVAPAGPAPLAVDAAGIQSDGAASATRAQALPLPPRPDAPTALAAPSETGAWGPLLDWGIQGKHMALLSTGRVLVWSTGDNARVWDPSTGLFTLAPATFGDLHCAGQSILADGRVIVVGGVLGAPHDGTNITALFDPVTQTWTRGQDMTDLRWYATSTTLADGRVLATSGDAPDGTRSEIPEVYDPVTDTWTRLTTAQRSQGLYPFMFVLPDGRVYEAGSKSATAYLDPAGTGSWTDGPSAGFSTSGYSESAVMYRPGKIMRAGGGDPAVARTAVIDMTVASPAWRTTAPMQFARRRLNLTLLADGSVMATGGTAQGDDVAQAVYEGEIWDPDTETWTTVERMTDARMYHSASVLLPDGRVLTAGGESAGRLRAQIYSPPYLFAGPRPIIDAAPGSAAYGSSFTIATSQAASIARVSLIRPSAVTHALDMDQRFVPLAFSAGSGSLSVTAPASGGIAPPGFYMLVIEDAAGVPSVASWIRIGTAGSLQPGSVAGRVTDGASGAPLAGVSVTSSSGSTTTDGDGRYTLSGVPAGELLVTFSAAGYATIARSATVVGGATTTLDVALSPPGGVVGRITDSTSGLPIPGATVGYPGGTAVADADGRYAIAGLPAGPIQLTVGATGYVSTQVQTVVPSGSTATADVALTPSATYITGEVTDATSGVVLVGATVQVVGGPSTTTDAQGRYRLDVPAGSYDLTASATGYEPASGPVIVTAGVYSTLDVALTPTGGGPPEVVTLTATADAFTKSTSATRNYGREATLRVRGGSPAYSAYLRFDLSGLAGRTVTGATLRLYASDGGPQGGTVVRTGTTWTETTIAWGNAPAAVAGPLASIGAVGSGAWVEVALPLDSVAGGTALSLAISGTHTNSVYYSSREGSAPPELRLELDGDGGGGGGGPSPVAAFEVAPTTGQAPLSVAVTDASTGAPTSWTWDWGDGSTSSGQAPAPHLYSAPGAYTIALTVANGTGSSTATRAVTVTAPPPPPPSGSRIKDITFEAGLLDATSGVDSVSGSVGLETATALSGTASARIAQAVGYLEERFVATDDAWVRLTIRLDSLPSGSPRVVMLSNAGTTQANLVLTSSGRLRLRIGSTTVGVDSPPLAVGTTYAVGLHQRRGSGGNAVAEAFLAPVGQSFGAPFAARTTGTWTTAADRLRIGATNGNAVAVTVDDVRIDGGAMPSAGSPSTGVTAASGITGSTAATVVERSVAVAPPRLSGTGFVCPV